MFYLTTHSTHFIYGYMASGIWLRTILIVRKETRCRHIGYSFRLAARVLLYASSHRQDNTYHSLCYTSRGALAGTRYSSMGPPHEGSIRRPIAPWANALTKELHLAPWWPGDKEKQQSEIVSVKIYPIFVSEEFESQNDQWPHGKIIIYSWNENHISFYFVNYNFTILKSKTINVQYWCRERERERCFI